MIPIDEKQYKVDFDIANGYINFSSELLRLSLLAITGFGALILIRDKNEPIVSNLLQKPSFLIISMFLFTLCACATLFHRYFASDSMSWYISWLRSYAVGNTEKAKTEQEGFYRMLNGANITLIIAEVLFGGAVLFFMIAIYLLITK